MLFKGWGKRHLHEQGLHSDLVIRGNILRKPASSQACSVAAWSFDSEETFLRLHYLSDVIKYIKASKTNHPLKRCTAIKTLIF